MQLSFDTAVEYLERFRSSDPRPGLSRVTWLCGSLGHPERFAPVVHVTGTNGKGSTARLIASILTAAGLRTGLYTSPHLESIEERIAVDGVPIGRDEFVSLVAALAPSLEHAQTEVGTAPSHFEALTALGLVALRGRAVDASVIEVGVGGRLDSTNVVDGRVAVITNVDLDHTEVLGSTRAAIAEEKAGIIKPGAIAVIGESDPDCVAVLTRRCAEVGATPLLVGRDFAVTRSAVTERGRSATLRTPRGSVEVEVPFHGSFQAENAACALVAAQAFLGAEVAPELVARAWREVANPGRLEILAGSPPVVIDVAHNPAGVRALAAALDERFPGRRRVVVLGVNPHKDAEAMVAALSTSTRLLVATQVDDAPAIPAEFLAKSARAIGVPETLAVEDPSTAVAHALAAAGPDEVVVCTGSHYWIGRVRASLRARASGA